MAGIVTVDFASDALPATVRVQSRRDIGDIGLVTFSLTVSPVELSSRHLTVVIRHGTASDGHFDVVPPERLVSIDFDNPRPMTAVTIAPGFIEQIFERMPADFHRRMPVLAGISDSKVTDLVRDLHTLAAGSSHFERLRLEAIAMLLMLHLYERYGVDAGPSPVQGGLGAARQRRVLDHIDAHLGKNIGMRALAHAAGLSRDHFAKAFKASIGISPHRYIGERRILRAKEMLLDRGRSITDVALDLGFASSSHFSDSFRKATGITPSQYRKDRI